MMMSKWFLLVALMLACFAMLSAAPPVVPLPGAPTSLPVANPPVPRSADGLVIRGVGIPDHLQRPVLRSPALTGPNTIRGVVVDVDHDQPIPDARVVLLQVGVQGTRQSLNAIDSTEADAKGIFTFTSLPDGQYVLEAYHISGSLVPWDFGDKDSRLITLAGGAEKSDVRVPVYGGHRLRVVLEGYEESEAPDRTRIGRSGPPVHAWRHFLLDPGDLLLLRGMSISGFPEWDGDAIEFQSVFGREVRLTLRLPYQWVADEDGSRLDDILVSLSPDQYDVDVRLRLMPPPVLRGRITQYNGTAPGPGRLLWIPGEFQIGAPVWTPGELASDGTFAVEIAGRRDGSMAFSFEELGEIHYGPVLVGDIFPDFLTLTIPDNRGSLAVRVTDHDGNPVPRATAHASIADYRATPVQGEAEPRFWFLPTQPEWDEDSDPRQNPRNFQIVFSTTTDEEGMARFDGLFPGRYSVVADPPPGSASLASPRSYVRLEADQELEHIARLAQPLPYGGIVLGSDGKPLAGATVMLRRMTTSMPSGAGQPVEAREAFTDRDGRFRFEAVGPEELTQVLVRQPGDMSQVRFSPSQMVGAYQPGTEDAVLQVGSRNMLRTRRFDVLDGITGERIAGAKLTTPNGTPIDYNVNAEGQLEIQLSHAMNRPSQSEFVIVHAEGYASSPFMVFGVYSSPPAATLYPPVSITGRVIDASGGNPIDGALVDYYGPVARNLWPEGSPAPFTTKSDKDGRFVLANVPADISQEGTTSRSPFQHLARTLTVQASDYPLRSMVVSFPEVADVDLGDIRLPAGVTLPVLVSRDGVPVGNVAVELQFHDPHLIPLGNGQPTFTLQQTTGEDGIALFEGLTFGRYNIVLPEHQFSKTIASTSLFGGVDMDLGSGTIRIAGISGDAPERISATPSGRVASGLKPQDRHGSRAMKMA
jgi:protocatechuate 3,4-dioxygenase beta subunit